MPSGSSWSKKNGFKLAHFNYSNINEDIKIIGLKIEPKFDKQKSLSIDLL